MKRKFLILALSTIVTAGAASIAFAAIPTTAATAGEEATAPIKQHPGDNFKKQRERKHAAVSELLGLTDAQQAQIKAIISASRQANTPLRQKLAGDRKKIRELSNATPFDETAVRALLAGNEAARTDLAVSRIKVRNQIQAVLTPDQQEKAKQLRLLSPNNQRKWGNPGF